MTDAGKTCFLNGPRHPYEECKVLKDYSKNYAVHQIHKDNKSRSNGNTKRDKSVKFDSKVKEANVMEHGNHIPKKNKGNK